MKKFILCVFTFLIFCQTSQAIITPLSLQHRVNECNYLVVGKVVHTVSYWNQAHTNIYTLHEIAIDGYWKGQSSATHIGVVDLGGQVGYDKQETHPSVHLAVGTYGVFMLDGALGSDTKLNGYRTETGEMIQALPTASIQGAIVYQHGVWMDPAQPNKPWNTSDFFGALERYSSGKLKNSKGKVQTDHSFLQTKNGQTANKTTAISALQDGNNITTTLFNAGVSNNPSMEMIINGSGFGNTAGTIEFADADAGGGANTFVFPTSTAGLEGRFGAASDIISWTNSQIRIRVPRSAGTGNMEIFDANNNSQGSTAITIDWTIIPVYTSFSGFASSTSQFIKLIDDNGTGGYTFEMSTTGSADFFNNAAAKEAFRRAVNTWRCGTEINWDLNLAAGTTNAYADDGTNVVVFDNSLPSGVLGRATTRTAGNASGTCNLHNTFWRTREIDLQFQTIPFSGFTWNFNSGGTTANEFSFETVALHELGHGHGMGHVIDASKVMHFSSSNGTQVVTLSNSDIDAGNYKVDNSTVANCFSTPAPMVALFNPCIPLPIDLLSLSADAFGEHNKIFWQTENETGIAKYTVQHSTNAVDFTPLGDVQSNTFKTENDYVFIHQNPNSENYYRLQILDLNEKTSYSETVYFKRNKPNDFKLYPNPTNDYLNIQISNLSLVTNQVDYTIKDLSGKILSVKNNKVNARDAILVENLKALPSGMYFIELSINGASTTQKIVKE